MTQERISRDEIALQTAELWAKRGTCNRLEAGCVIVGEKKVLSIGYNSSHRDTPHCNEVGCLIEEDHCVRCLHAEEAAIINMETRRIQDLVVYVTHTPCIRCYKLLTSAGAKIIYIRNMYGTLSSQYNQLIPLKNLLSQTRFF